MMSNKQSNEQRYFDALKLIAAFSSPEELHRNAEKFGLYDGFEHIEMAYENAIAEARAAVFRKRRPTK